MKSGLDAALSGEPWSLMGIINGFESGVDDEGRPLFEGRAPVQLRQDVPMRIKRCPYDDERLGRNMNVSALQQIIDHLPETERDIADLRAHLPDFPPNWRDTSIAMLDQMAQPALHVLQARRRDSPVPARMAVGYKVAIGYSKPILALLELELVGRGRPATVETLIEFVHEQRHFVGAREVCAGPTNMVERVARTLMESRGDATTVPNARARVAETLSFQLQLMSVWRHFDRAFERRLLLEEVPREALAPRNQFLTRTLDERIADHRTREAMEDEDTTLLCPPLPPGLPAPLAEQVEAAVDVGRGRAPRDLETTRFIERLMQDGAGAIELRDRSLHARFAASFADYLVGYRGFVEAQCALERRIRLALELDTEVPVKLDSSVFPAGRALGWYETVLGFRLGIGRPPFHDVKMRGTHRIATMPPPRKAS